MIESALGRFGEQVSAVVIYTREAHPRLGDAAYLRDPQNLEDRRKAARQLARTAGLSMPILLDTPHNRAAQLLDALPSRLILLDREGRIAWKSHRPPAQTELLQGFAALDRLIQGHEG